MPRLWGAEKSNQDFVHAKVGHYQLNNISSSSTCISFRKKDPQGFLSPLKYAFLELVVYVEHPSVSEHISNPTESAHCKCKMKTIKSPMVADKAQIMDTVQVFDLLSSSQMLKQIWN